MSFKKIIIKDNTVFIHHNIKAEYNDNDFISSYTFKNFKDDILKSYQIGIDAGWTTLVSVTNKEIVTSMPRYDMILCNLNKFDLNKLLELIDEMNKLNIYHDDLALRNIGIDPFTGKYKLIDLSSLTKDDYLKISRNGNVINFGTNSYLKNDLKELE